MKKINILICYLILVVNHTSCYTNIIDTGMDGFVEQSTEFNAPSADDAVDLGLSVKWAPYNVGASKPTEYGNYYAWGEIEPKTDYSSETYIGPIDFFGSVDTYGTEYDVAYVKWGHEWRIPTMDELIEIHEKCKWESAEQDGVKGMKVTGPNGNFIFFPAAGRCVGNRFEDVGITGHYWQGCANKDGSQSGEYTYYDLNQVFHGLTIRPVLSNIANANQLYYTFIDNTDGEAEWDKAMVMSNGYYSLIQRDTLNNTIVYLDKVGTQATSSNVIGEFDGNGNLTYLHIDSDTYYFYNYRDDHADAMTFRNGEMEIVENVKIVRETESQTKGVSQNDYFNALGSILSASGAIKGGAEGVVDALSLMFDFGEFTPNQELALDMSFTAAGVGVAGLAATSVAAFLSSPAVIGAAIVGTSTAFLKWWENTKNEEKEQRYYESAANCMTRPLDPVMVTATSYKIGMEVINSGSIKAEYKSLNYCGIILQKIEPPHFGSFNAYSSDVETVLYMRVPDDGRYEIILSNLEGGYTYRYRSFVIPKSETANFGSPEGQLLNPHSGSASSSAIYYSDDIKSFIVDNACIVDCTQAEEPYCKDGKIHFKINVTAQMSKAPSSYAFVDWGVVMYNKDKRINATAKSIGKGIKDGSVTITFEADASSLDVDSSEQTAKTLNHWFVSTYMTFEADGVSSSSDGLEKYPVDLVYNQEPSITIKGLSVGSTVPLSEGDWGWEYGWDYETAYSTKLYITGAFWMDEIYCFDVIDGLYFPFSPHDGEEKRYYRVRFSSEAPPRSEYMYYVTTVNGRELKSTNNVGFDFNGSSCSIYLFDGARSTSMVKTLSNASHSATVSEIVVTEQGAGNNY